VTSSADLERTQPFTKPSLCAIGSCGNPHYCPDDDISQVHCARFGCGLWYHANCVAGITNPAWYASHHTHARGRMLATPEPAGRNVRAANAAALQPEALWGALDHEKIAVLVALAGQPIVRPTSRSVTGNAVDVLKARGFIRDARRTDGPVRELLQEAKTWLEELGDKRPWCVIERDAREARARAAGVRLKELEEAIKEDRKYELLVCPLCGHAM
jgi:hypothetical protein